ncbi:MAG: hypothetical protein HQL20_07945 [Candidatus Omnitrophica bacterium]|nr:hypothetical protein [Candidatus Omnitrophota bacterium]
MARKKPNQSLFSIDLVRWLVIAVFVLIAVIISVVALVSFVRHSGIFLIREVVVAESLGEINIPELAKIKGKNIFQVNLAVVEQKILAKYPGVAGLAVLRRFPDEIAVLGARRTAFAAAQMDGRVLALSRDGCFIGAPGDGPLVVIKGLARQKTATGTLLTDPDGAAILAAVEQVAQDPALTALHLRTIDVSAVDKSVFSFGLSADPARFDVIVDKESYTKKLKTLSVMVARTGLAVNEVKYIDLRFETPVIGKRTSKK